LHHSSANEAFHQFISFIIDFLFEWPIGVVDGNLYPAMRKQFIIKVISYKLFLIGNILWIFMSIIETTRTSAADEAD